jgi:hypothetical protein
MYFKGGDNVFFRTSPGLAASRWGRIPKIQSSRGKNAVFTPFAGKSLFYRIIAGREKEWETKKTRIRKMVWR